MTKLFLPQNVYIQSLKFLRWELTWFYFLRSSLLETGIYENGNLPHPLSFLVPSWSKNISVEETYHLPTWNSQISSGNPHQKIAFRKAIVRQLHCYFSMQKLSLLVNTFIKFSMKDFLWEFYSGCVLFLLQKLILKLF